MIELTYTLSEAEFKEGQKVWCSKQLRKLPGTIASEVVKTALCVFIFLSLGHLPGWLAIGLGCSAVAILVVGRWRKRAIEAFEFRVYKETCEAAQITIDGTGYRDQSASGCGGWVNWKGFTGWKETHGIFVLGRNLAFTAIPKRKLEPEQQAELRALLFFHLGAAD